MRKLTKKSLDEMAKTMNVIPVEERDNYWGMLQWENDCFWRCIAYLASNGLSYDGYSAGSYAESYFSDTLGGIYQAYNHLSVNGAEMTYAQMKAYIKGNSTFDKKIVGFTSEILNKYGFNGDTNHVVVFLNTASNGSDAILYCPQTNTTFTMFFADYKERIFQ